MHVEHMALELSRTVLSLYMLVVACSCLLYVVAELNNNIYVVTQRSGNTTVDDCLRVADTVSDAIELQSQLHVMFSRGGLTLRKWNSSDLTVLDNIPSDLKDVKSSLPIPNPEE